jgi:DNA polymerase III subunit beta
MKIQVLTEGLQKKLSFINHAVSARSQLLVLQKILLETSNGRIKLSSTDLEVGIETFCQAVVVEEGGTTVPTKLFTELINSLPSETITVEVIDGKLIVSSKKTKSVLQTIPKEEFPKLYDEKGTLIAKLQTEHLRSYIDSLIFAASQDNAKPALSGILVKHEKDGFLLVATDGYRLSLKRYSAATFTQDPANTDVAMIIPSRVFRELNSIKEEAPEVAMFVAKSSNQVIFEIGETLVIGRLIEATYPNYERIIPLDFSAQVKFDREELQKAVKICSIFARDSANIIKLSISKDVIVVSSQSASVGENTVRVEAQLTGEPNEIAFNARYLIDALGNIDTERMVFAMTGPLNPGVFKIENDESYLHLIMPIRVQGES